MTPFRRLLENSLADWKQIAALNVRHDLVDLIFGIELQVIELLRLEAHPEVLAHPLPHLRD